MPITLLTNVAAVQTQRHLTRTSKELFKNFERLSSGLRINRASDDAAGLSIAEALRVDARVFAQGMRNANDGISLLNIAEGSVSELSTILTRMLELAEQSANGVYTGRQRIALHSESNSLRKEYNRIVVSTEFNKRSILTSAQEELRFQLGYGTNGSIGFSITADLERNVGAGSFSSTIVNTLNPNSNRAVASGDINGDGLDDLVTKDGAANLVTVAFSQGNGLFQANQTVALIANAPDLDLLDVNTDGRLDMVTSNTAAAGGLFVSLGSTTGTFGAFVSYDLPQGRFGPSVQTYGDFNGDGRIDVASTAVAGSAFRINFGNGNGSFKAADGYGVAGFVAGITNGDFNGDGSQDLAMGRSGGQLEIYYGAGNGQFGSAYTVSDVSLPAYGGFQVGDIDDDGDDDIVSARGNGDSTVHIYKNNGNGTFANPVLLTAGVNTNEPRLIDFNGDDILDIAVAADSDNTFHIFLGRGDGSYLASTSYSVADSYRLTAGDFNGDGVTDLAASNYGSQGISVFLTATRGSTTLEKFDLRTRESALEAITGLRAALERVSSEIGTLGAQRSRLDTGLANLTSAELTFLDSRSRIVDVDIADEASKMTKHRILQQVSASVAAQANQQTALALTLLGDITLR